MIHFECLFIFGIVIWKIIELEEPQGSNQWKGFIPFLEYVELGYWLEVINYRLFHVGPNF
jgi:hypothetical protein